MEALLPDLVLLEGRFVPATGVVIGDAGRIASVGEVPRDVRPTRLPGIALLPGFVNGHSHAFQRAIRGRTEWRQPGHEADDFWTWREQMYAAATRLSPEDLEAVSRMAFVEMALAGITSVGEFHYLQHQADGTPYAQPDELALRVAAAAADAGIGLVLLRVGYARAGFGRSPDPRQARFVDPSPEECLAAVERLAARGLSVGLAPHSVRAQPLAWLRSLAEHAQRRSLPLHMHVSEQPRELAECLEEHGLRPVELLDREGLLDARFTAVHGVHLGPGEVSLLARAGATVCACPTTERNLGDGVAPTAELFAAGVDVALGTDSQIQLAPLEDARQLEYHQRLVRLQRAVLGRSGGDEGSGAIAGRLLSCATTAGARALGLPAGEIRAGLLADLVGVALDDPSICGASGDALLASLVFSAERTAIREVWVRGRHIVSAGRHVRQAETVAAFLHAMHRLWGSA